MTWPALGGAPGLTSWTGSRQRSLLPAVVLCTAACLLLGAASRAWLLPASRGAAAAEACYRLAAGAPLGGLRGSSRASATRRAAVAERNREEEEIVRDARGQELDYDYDGDRIEQVAEDNPVEMWEVRQLQLPVMHKFPVAFRRLLLKDRDAPEHLVQRKWLAKGRKEGFVSVPFPSAVSSPMSQSDVNVVLLSKREPSEVPAKMWQELLKDEGEDLPSFDISGEVTDFSDLDSLEPPYDTPLDQPLPSDDELRRMCRGTGENSSILSADMERLYPWRDLEELRLRVDESQTREECKILRQVVDGLPVELRRWTPKTAQEGIGLVRETSMQIQSVLLALRAASNCTRLRWRFASVGAEEDANEDTLPVGIRAYFVLAGGGLEFVPAKYIDTAKDFAASILTPEQRRRISSEDWAASETVAGTNITQALKRVPAGWTTFVKGDQWPGNRDSPAVFRLPQTGKRIFIQVDAVDGPSTDKLKNPEARSENAESGGGQAHAEADFSWAGPTAGLLGLIWGFARKSAPFKFGQKRRRAVDEFVKGATRQRKGPVFSEDSIIAKLEMKNSLLYPSFSNPEQAPSVLLIGADTPTGRVMARQLVNHGYNVRAIRLNRYANQASIMNNLVPLANGVKVFCIDEPGYPNFNDMPTDIYSAMTGVDKVVVCSCDTEHEGCFTGPETIAVLSSFQIYRIDFSERQKSFSSKVMLFNFNNPTDNSLWQLEDTLSDLCYGEHRAKWGSKEILNDAESLTSFFVGEFYEEVGQVQLKSPKLKLNFKKFSGLLLYCHNHGHAMTYNFFLRLSDFDETRIQYEHQFSLEGTRWNHVRMPFESFRPVRVDGLVLPPEEAAKCPFRREDVVQMGVCVRTRKRPRKNYKSYFETGVDHFRLALHFVKAFRTQKEPQVVYVGSSQETVRFRDTEEEWEQNMPDDVRAMVAQAAKEREQEDFSSIMAINESDNADYVPTDKDLGIWKTSEDDEDVPAENDGAADGIQENSLADADPSQSSSDAPVDLGRDPTPEDDVSEPTGDDSETYEYDRLPYVPRSPIKAVLGCGLCYSIVKVNGLNDQPGGQLPTCVNQASVHLPPASPQPPGAARLGSVSRGDLSAFVASALITPNCANAEVTIGALPLGVSAAELTETGESQDGSETASHLAEPGEGEAETVFVVGSTVEEDVKRYLQRLKPCL